MLDVARPQGIGHQILSTGEMGGGSCGVINREHGRRLICRVIW